MDTLPPELLSRIFALVNSSELAAVRHARRQGKSRARKTIRSIRLVCHAFARISAPYLFASSAVLVFPSEQRLREFCQLAKSYIGPHVKRCVFRADEALIQFPADKLNMNLMHSAAFSVRQFRILERVDLDFLPAPCCRASGVLWITQRPNIILRMFAEIGPDDLPHLDTFVVSIFRKRFRHFKLTIDLMSEARYISVPVTDQNGRPAGMRMEYIPETRLSEDQQFCEIFVKMLAPCNLLHSLRLSLPNSELISPHSFSILLRELHLPHLTHFSLAYAPVHVSAMIAFMARHEQNLRRIALFDLELRADREGIPIVVKHSFDDDDMVSESHGPHTSLLPDLTLPWVALNAWLSAVPNVRCTMSIVAPGTWRSEMAEKDLSKEWTFKAYEQVCSNCSRTWTKVDVPFGRHT
ncbi:hypothetical protein BKA62DRAFT_741770 [Auriculariales sp. MPI-PUGE-AT-0066]|nr:hypothetical protein BKA62DRAFT_741770 [Auriculariales sp. MPI-PUGE-AT-0066]